MEYYRPRYDESPDPWLVERHQREIAPLLKRRWVFAESHDFLLYDFFESSGSVDENVYAYSNRAGNERALIVFNNRYGETHGTVHNSAAYADKGSSQLRQRRIHDGFGFDPHSGAILSWRDSLTGLEYLRRARDVAERGITFHLHAYQCHVLMDWHEKWASAEKPWDRLCDQLNGRGVPSLEDALVELELEPVHQALRALFDQDTIRMLTDMAEHPRTTAANGTVSVALDRKTNRARSELFNVTWSRCEAFIRLAQPAFMSRAGKQSEMTMPGLLGPAFRERLAAALRIPVVETLCSAPWTAAARRVLPSPSPQMAATAMWAPVIAWCVLETLAESIDSEKPETAALQIFEQLRLRKPLAEAFASLGFEGESAWRAAARIKVLLLAKRASAQKPDPDIAAEKAEAGPLKLSTPEEQLGSRAELSSTHELVAAHKAAPRRKHELAPIVAGLPRALWSDPDVRWLTGVHDAGEYSYLVQEPFEELLWWLQMPAILRLASQSSLGKPETQSFCECIQDSIAEAERAGYRLQALLGSLEEQISAPEQSQSSQSATAEDASKGTAPEIAPTKSST
jgi:hypothetical protein